MKTGVYTGALETGPRTHPWSTSVANAAWRYRDLRAEPALIRTALEDFVPWAAYPAVEAFYALLELLNGPASTLETSDCAFTGPQADGTDPAMQCEGRVIVLFRALAANVGHGLAELVHQLHLALAALDPGWEGGMIGTTLVPVRYVNLGTDGQDGQQLLISFWAWGDSEIAVMANLRRVIANLTKALRSRAVK